MIKQQKTKTDISDNILNVLVCDLDGTLIKSDMLLESFFALLKKNIFFIFLMPLWLIKGKAHLKHEIARRVNINCSCLPYNHEFLSFLQNQHQQGRILVLATASDQLFAKKIANHLGIFHDVLGSHSDYNLKGTNKLKTLQEKFGRKGFDYAGNDLSDLKVWAHANAAIVVNGSNRLVEKTKKITHVSHVFHNSQNILKPLLKAIRMNQWIKNFLIFIPYLAAHKLTDYRLLLNSVYAFIGFSLLSSSVYLLNDLIDLENDRHHHIKKNRPFASGDLSLFWGFVLIPLLLILCSAISLFLPQKFLLIMGLYYIVTLAYSFRLKQIVLIDIIVLATLYMIRIIAGGAATGIPISKWLLTFSIFIFLSLAFSKRFSELYNFRKNNNEEKVKGRGYFVGDLHLLSSLGPANGFVAILVFVLYLDSSEVRNLYRSPEWLWLICLPLIYWISRVWLLTYRGEMHEDPIVFVAKDRVSYFIWFVILCVFIIASI